MKCPYCGTENEIPKDFAQIEEHKIEDLPVMPAYTVKGFGVQQRSYKCDSCGAVQSIDPKLIAIKCAFCGSGAILETPSNPKVVRPNALVPFAINSAVSKQKYLDWLKKLWFRPGDLKRTAAQAGVSGVYAPFFTFDAQAESNWSGWQGTYYYTTETYTTVVDGKPQTRTRQVQHTSWSHHSGHHSQFYNDILVNASSGLPEDILKKIYPYHLNGLIGYSTEFLAGFSAEEYTRNPASLWMNARQVVASSERSACSRELNGDTQRGLSVNTQIFDPKWKHILLPVYVSSYLYRGKRYNFLVNGQTGEVQGEAPLSWAKIGGLIAAVAGIIGGVVLLGRYLGWF
jgi:DNA-directed RNA polymerase subunit RPC12/RpoP